MTDVDENLREPDRGSPPESDEAATHVLYEPDPQGKTSPRPTEVPHFTPAARAARGRAARSELPRSVHGAWEPAPTRRDPVDLLEEQGEGMRAGTRDLEGKVQDHLLRLAVPHSRLEADGAVPIRELADDGQGYRRLVADVRERDRHRERVFVEGARRARDLEARGGGGGPGKGDAQQCDGGDGEATCRRPGQR